MATTSSGRNWLVIWRSASSRSLRAGGGVEHHVADFQNVFGDALVAVVGQRHGVDVRSTVALEERCLLRGLVPRVADAAADEHQVALFRREHHHAPVDDGQALAVAQEHIARMDVGMARHQLRRALQQDGGELLAAVDDGVDLFGVRFPEREEALDDVVAGHAVDEPALVAPDAFAPLVGVAFPGQPGGQRLGQFGAVDGGHCGAERAPLRVAQGTLEAVGALEEGVQRPVEALALHAQRAGPWSAMAPSPRRCPCS
jgi:hypothetical protein